MQQRIKTLACLALATSLFGCASTSSDEPQHTATTNIQLELFDKLKAQLNTASAQYKDEELEWFAARAYASMGKSLNTAQEAYSEFEHDPKQINDSDLFSSQTYGQEMTESLDAFETAHRNALETKQRVLSVMAISFENRQYLKTAKADTLFPSEFKRVEQQLKKTVDYVANNVEIDNERLVSLEKNQHQLEAKSVTKRYLGESLQQFSNQKKQRYFIDAPLVMARSEAALNKAEAFIQSSPRNHEEIQIRSDAVTFALQRADKIAQQVRDLKALPEKQYERYILNLEDVLRNIAVASSAGDYRNQTLIDHAKQIEHSMMSNQQSDQEKWQALTVELSQVKQDWQQDIETFTAQSNALSAEKQTLENQIIELQTQRSATMSNNDVLEKPQTESVVVPGDPADISPQDTEVTEPIAPKAMNNEAQANT
ncbi:hypothetical protein BCU70_00545 [Vibrio sp. 10N.286.49.C2]|uniref:hypothetical protein n=1 Tax=unclassified Vibrio TaxID=2614977 RepID=UPI000C82B256|nr:MULTISPECIES: hypothetical protein [unclassified Vibrio]PMH43385.1 hypothetical protein BCU70_00545 [Vibrio sp. 10N.286.49.C2]PMH57037.1 hypothetical protein BCU66_05935 [Vibrio sp. 10N.286.49.B1]PMH80315.1 hypothetical protein BCU58_23845 [Vibrio sp. 10N.286.48.B7]